LLFGTPRLIRNLTISQKRKLPSGKIVSNKPELIDLQQTLNNLEITQDQLITMGILIGTDYNIGGVNRVGPKTALKLVKQHNSIDQLFREVEADFDWKEIRDIFKKMPVTKEYKLEWKKPDVEKIKEILVDRHEFSPERVDATLEKLKQGIKKKEQKGLGEFFT
jgi:flap endonuclease-1